MTFKTLSVNDEWMWENLEGIFKSIAGKCGKHIFESTEKSVLALQRSSSPNES